MDKLTTSGIPLAAPPCLRVSSTFSLEATHNFSLVGSAMYFTAGPTLVLLLTPSDGHYPYYSIEKLHSTKLYRDVQAFMIILCFYVL